MLETITLESAVKYSIPLAKKLFNKKITPILTGKIAQYFKNRSDQNDFEKESVKYIAWVTGQCSTINTIAFPNTPKKLDDLYLPLKIISEGNVEIVVNDDANIFEVNDKILVNDTAGMGKTTLSKKVVLNTVKNNNYIPIFVELRQLEKQPIAEQIASKFGINTKYPDKFLSKLPLIYVFDGLDEVSSSDKSYIIKAIRDFIDLIESPKILITSRLESYLSEFYDFTRFTIAPLVESEAFSLISKYDPEGDVSKKLIEGIGPSRDLREFLSTPLYVSLLFCAYRHKTVIPQKKHLFYSQVYEALFESHDLSKEISFTRPKHSKLDSSEFHMLLRRLGFWCLKHGGKIEFQKDELEIIMEGIISSANGIDTNAANFVKDLTTTVPIFVKEGSSLRWSHKSLMEYFSSMFICNDVKDKQQGLLLHLYLSNDWSSYKNIFELCADIDFSSLRASVVKKLLEDFVNYHNSNYQNITNTRIKPITIEERIGLSFCRSFGFKIFKSNTVELNNDTFWSDNNPDVCTIRDSCGAVSDNEISQFVIHCDENHLLHGITAYSRESMIVKILEYKCPILILNNGDQIDFKARTKLINSTIKKEKLYVVSDVPTALINNSKYFHLMNELLFLGGGVALNFEEAQRELENIKLDSSNGIDQLIGEFDGQS